MPNDQHPPGSRWTRPFAIDLRALGALRVALGSILCVDMLLRLSQLDALHSDAAAYPMERAREMLFYPVSIHLISGAPAYQATLLLVALAAGVALVVGYRTRLMSVVSWYLLLSLHHRCYHYQDVGDHLLLLLLMWGMLLPWGARYSLDARKGRLSGAVWVRSLASAGMLLQIASLIFFSSLHKLESPFWSQGEAVGLVLQDDMWVSPLGELFAPYPELCRWLTYGTLVVEFGVPLILFSPFALTACRSVGVIALGLFVVGIGASLPLGVIPWVVTASLIPFAPQGVWAWLDRRLGASPATPQEGARVLGSKPAVQAISALLIVQALAGNIDSLHFPPRIPLALRKVESTLNIGQAWSMYTPDPTPSSFRVHLRLDLEDGEQVQLVIGSPRHGWPDGETLPVMEDLWNTYRGMELVDAIVYREYAQDLRPFLVWACRQWSAAHPDRTVVSAGLSKEVRAVRHRKLGPGELYPVLDVEPLVGHLCSEHAPGRPD